jgi:copper transport protein
MRRYTRYLQSVALALAVLLTVFTGVASAHEVEVVKSDPAAGAVLDRSPAQVKAWFNEELQTGTSTLVILDAGGNQVDGRDGGVDLDDPEHASMVVSLPALPDGTYTASWYAVLLDGDPSQGEFAFSVGQAPAVQAVADSHSSPAEPVAKAPAARPAPQAGSGLPIAWIVLGLGVLAAGGILGALLIRSRSADSA